MKKWGINFLPMVMVLTYGTSAALSIWFLWMAWGLLTGS